jgi:hypothetical protein
MLWYDMDLVGIGLACFGCFAQARYLYCRFVCSEASKQALGDLQLPLTGRQVNTCLSQLVAQI